MKRLSLIVIAALFVISAGCVKFENHSSSDFSSIKTYKDIPGVTAEEINAIEALKKACGSFTYGHLKESESFILPNGEVKGFTILLANHLSDLFGAEFSPVYCDEWEILKKGIDTLEIDFSGVFTPTPERKKTYYMSLPIASRNLKLYSMKDSPPVEFVTDVDGRKLGFLRDTVTSDTIREYYPELSFEVVEADSSAHMVELLQTGKVDGFVGEGAAEPHYEDYDFIRSQDFFEMVYSPVSMTTANPEMSPVISVIDKYILAGGADKFYEMYTEGQHEYTRFKLDKSFTDEEKAYLAGLAATDSTVKVALESDNYPVCFYNAVDKEFQGIAVEVLAEIEKLVDIKFEAATTKDNTWAEIYEKLKTDEIPMVSQLLYNETRKEFFIWGTEPYAHSYYAFISKADFPNMTLNQVVQATVGMTKQTGYEDMFNKYFPGHADTKVYNYHDEGMAALDRGEIDLFMGSEYLLLMQMNYHEKPGYKVNIRLNFPMDSYFGFHKDQAVLRSIIDKAQVYVEKETIEENWTNRIFDYSKKMAQMQIIYLTFFLGIMIMVSMVLVFQSSKNKRLGKSLMERSSKLNAIYESIPDMVFSKSIDGTYTSCNQSFTKYAGIPEEEVLGKTDEEIFKDHDYESVERHIETDRRIVETQAPEIIDEVVTYKDGTRRMHETIKAPIFEGGKAVGVICIGRDVTERSEIKDRSERVLNTAQIAYFLTVDDIITEANEYSRNYIGMKLGEDVGRYYVTEEQRAEIIRKTEKYDTAYNIIVNFKLATGQEHRFLSNFAMVDYKQRKARIAWAIDIEDVEKKNDQLRSTQKNLQNILDMLPLPIRIFDLATGQIVYVNESFLELFEYASAEEVCVLNISDLIPDTLSDGTSSSERKDKIMYSSEPVALEMEYRTKTGETFDALVVARHIKYKNRRASIGIIKDLTSEKERARILLRAIEREKDANQAKSLFLANMSHEIRTPMNGIIGFSELALDSSVTQEAKDDYLRKIKDSGESLLQIINDILDISKIESGNMELENIPFNLHDVFGICQTIITPKALEKGIELYFYGEPSVGKRLMGDPTRLRQVLLNLLSNALKFTNVGIVKLSSVIKETTLDNVTMHFEIKDSGIGMSETQIARIFEPFMQADASTTREYGGTGLGLSITKNIIELMGGKLNVESAPGLGSKFSFDLTFKTIDIPAEIDPGQIVFNEYEKPVFSGSILICEDNEINQKVLSDHLLRVGLNIEVANNGQEGVDLVLGRMNRGEKPFDLIFMDMHMPVMDGLEAARRLNQLGNTTPIVALTANVMATDKEIYRAHNMPDYVAKPFTTKELWTCLYKYFTPLKMTAVDMKEQNEAAARSRKRLHTDFVRDYSSIYNDIMDAINADDIKLAHRLVHTLKGLAGLMGKASLQKAANSVEHSLEHGKAEATEEQLNTLERELNTVIEELKPLLDESEPIMIEPTTFDKNEAAALFDKLTELLESYSAECVELAEELRTVPRTVDLIKQIENYEYELALETLESVRNELGV